MADDDPFINALARSYDGDPSTADVMARYRAPQWGGLKSYMPDQPDWMKTAQNALGRGLEAIPDSVALAANFLPGANALASARSLGTFVWVELVQATGPSRFALESCFLDVELRARSRVRG